MLQFFESLTNANPALIAGVLLVGSITGTGGAGIYVASEYATQQYVDGKMDQFQGTILNRFDLQKESELATEVWQLEQLQRKSPVQFTSRDAARLNQLRDELTKLRRQLKAYTANQKKS